MSEPEKLSAFVRRGAVAGRWDELADRIERMEAEVARLREIERAAQATFDACGNGDDALGGALVMLGLALSDGDCCGQCPGGES
jgi:hypothetical protein